MNELKYKKESAAGAKRSKGRGKIRLGVIHLTFYPTFTRWRRVAPLPVGLTLAASWPLHLVAAVAHEADHVVEVEAIAHRAAIDGTAWVSAADGWRGEGEKKKQKGAFKSCVTARADQRFRPPSASASEWEVGEREERKGRGSTLEELKDF